jgi:DNA-binding transcriptional ArsR family regulator
VDEIETAGLLKALADPARVAVVEILTEGPRRAGELAEAAGVTAATMSKHLRVLLQAGVVVDARSLDDARLRLYHLRPSSVVALRAWVDQLQAQWDEQLQSFKRHMEAKQ